MINLIYMPSDVETWKENPILPKRGVWASDQAKNFCGFDSLPKDHKTCEEVMTIIYLFLDQKELSWRGVVYRPINKLTRCVEVGKIVFEILSLGI